MQRSPRMAADVAADALRSLDNTPRGVRGGSAAFGGFVPPSWAESSWLLRASIALWCALLAVAATRAALNKFFHSKQFRALLKREKARAAAARRRRRGGAAAAAAGRGGGGGGAAGGASVGRHRDESLLALVARRWRAAGQLIMRTQASEAQLALYLGLPRVIGGVVVCTLYIIDTYMQGVPAHFYAFQAAYGLGVTLILLMKFVYSEQPIHFVLSLMTIVECLSIPSLLTSNGGQWLNFNFLQAYCILVEWSVLEKHDIVLQNYSTLHRLLVNLVLQLITFVFITSCGVQLFELLGDPGSQLGSETFQITWANSVYFAVVTLMTVGYGDFVPYTLLGRLWIVFHIIFAAYLVTREISLLIDALKSMRRGGGSYVKAAGTEHIVITGHIKWDFFLQFVKEFLAERNNLDTKIIVLASNPEWSDDDWNKFVLHDAFYDHHLIYLEGSPLKDGDLTRAQVEKSAATFVFADPHRNDPYLSDSDTLKSLLTIRNYASEVPIFTLNSLHDSSFQFKIAMEVVDPSYSDWIVDDRSVLSKSRTYGNLSQLLPNMKAYLTSDPIFGSSPDFVGDYGLSGGVGVTRSAILPRSIPDMASPLPPAASVPGSAGGPGDLIAGDGDSYLRDDDLAAGVTGLGPINAAPERKRKRVSASVCMQKFEMAMLAENVFCNGLSTLITNLSWRIHLESRPQDKPWLLEYKLGTECGVRFITIPTAFEKRRFGDIALALYDYGLVLLAVRRSIDHNWTLMKVDTVLDSQMVAAVLTYHEENVVDKIAEHAARFVNDSVLSMPVDFDDDDIFDSAGCGDHRRLSSNVAGAVHSLEMDTIDDFTVLSPEPQVPSKGTTGNPMTELPGTSAGYPGHVLSRLSGENVGSGTAVSAESSRAAAVQAGNSSAVSTEHSSKQPGSRARLSSFPTSARPISFHSALGSNAAPSTIVPPLGDAAMSASTAFGSTPLSRSLRRPKVPVDPPAPRAKPDENVLRGATPRVSQVGTGAASGAVPSLRRSIGAQDPTDMRTGPRLTPDSSANAGVQGPTGVSRGVDHVDSTGRLAYRSIYSSRDALPAMLRGHVIICLDGEYPLINLDYLLSRIWLKRPWEEKFAPVVVVHPSFPKNFEREISATRHDLFLLRGNSLSLETLKQAQFESSRAILIMSSESSPGASLKGATDSKAIFTIMTLDSLLSERSTTFVCCMLDSEDSLQLLLSPSHTRRRHMQLGEHGETAAVYRQPSLGGGVGRSTSFRTSSSNHQLLEHTASQNEIPRSLSGTPNADMLPVSYGIAGTHYGSITAPFLPTNLTQQPSPQAIRQRLPRTTSMMTGLKKSNTGFLKRSTSVRLDGSESSDEGEEEEHELGSNVHNLKWNHNAQVNEREELNERMRLASGEMMISSMFAGMLVREFCESGFMNLVREMIGTGSAPERSWVRQIAVPPSWVESATSLDGRSYRETVKRLLELGCIPLGLYRSGDAPVRIALAPVPGSDPGVSISFNVLPRASAAAGDLPGDVVSDDYVAHELGRHSSAMSLHMHGSGSSHELLGTERSTAASSVSLPGMFEDLDRAWTRMWRALERNGQGGRSREATLLDGGARRGSRNGGGGGSGGGGGDGVLGVGVDAGAEEPTAGPDDDERDAFDEMYYICPTTKRRILYQEADGGENGLPYVYTNPEPYTAVAASDAVFVLCHPDVAIPAEW